MNKMAVTFLPDGGGQSEHTHKKHSSEDHSTDGMA